MKSLTQARLSLEDIDDSQKRLRDFKFIDLFAGIGGFHYALSKLGGECVMASEIDAKARKTYLANQSCENMIGDINDISPVDVPEHDVLCAGFPCQPFSQAGFKKGFEDARGTLFFNIYEIAKAKRPKALFLENVRFLLKHDDGKTFSVIKEMIESLGYSFHPFIVKACDHGVPQFRPRLFMICLRDGKQYTPPQPRELKLSMSDVLGGHCEREIGFTLRVGGRRSPIAGRHNWDGYIVDGEERRLTIQQGAVMQGLPEDFSFPVSDKEAMKQLGNSVAVPAIYDYARELLKSIC